ncbi:MAG: tRNA (adenosine(37)-N6)-threonylcarbamoyltransferase complex dimerization subunit type 1 TsaB [Beijerinckiaceae bacterium]
MRVLAIDTALGACAVCVYEAGSGTVMAQETAAMDKGHAEALIPMIERVMAQVDGGFAVIDRVAVTTGPGSYTGVRVGLSAANAIGFAAQKPVVGISTLGALAAPLIAAGEGTAVAAAIDARHGDIYLQLLTASGRSILNPRQIAAKEAARMMGSGPVRLVGSGAPRLAVEAWTIGIDAVVVDAPAAAAIVWIARLGALASPADQPARPLYLKAADAKPSRKALPMAPAS